MDNNILLQKYIEICDIHQKRLEDAYVQIKHLYPFKESCFPLKSYSDLASLDMFSVRLSKLQDTLGNKVFPLLLRHLGENIEGLSIIDMLNKLQKLLIVDDIHTWKILRDIRNLIAHEYPDSYELLSETLNQAIKFYPYLILILNKIKKRIKENDALNTK